MSKSRQVLEYENDLLWEAYLERMLHKMYKQPSGELVLYCRVCYQAGATAEAIQHGPNCPITLIHQTVEDLEQHLDVMEDLENAGVPVRGY